MTMPNLKGLATTLLQRNPSIANNPQAKVYLDAINSGDQSRMQQLATNICNSYGVTPEQAKQDTLRFFGLSR